MSMVDLPRVKRALAKLDDLVKAHPELTGPVARERLTKWTGEEMARGRKESQELERQVFVRMPADLVEGLDRHVERLALATPGLKPSRSDAIRALLYRALESLERERVVVEVAGDEGLVNRVEIELKHFNRGADLGMVATLAERLVRIVRGEL